MLFTEPETGDQHRIAFGVTRVVRAGDVTGHIDASDHRKATHDAPRAGRRERILVIDVGPAGPDDDLVATLALVIT